MSIHPLHLASRSLRSSLGEACSGLILFIAIVSELLCSGTVFAASSGKPLKLLQITPAGIDVPVSRQILFQFNRPVVPLGRMERNADEIPITIEPAVECRWRWLNPSSLACELDEKASLKPATRYRVAVRPGIRTEDHVTLTQEITHAFITQRPKTVSSWLKTWLAPGMPQLYVRFNQPVQKDSLSGHLYFKTHDGTRVPAVVQESPQHQSSEPNVVWLVSPEREIPPDTGMSLRTEPGILSAEGPEPGIDAQEVLALHTFPEFRFLGVECRTNAGETVTLRPDQSASAQPRCSPAQSVSLLFSAPVVKEEVQQGVRMVPGLAAGRADRDPWADVESYSRLSESNEQGKHYPVSFPWDVLKPYSDYRIHIETGALQDEFGRPLVSSVDMGFAMDHQPPELVLPKSIPVLEKGLDTDVPLWATNLDEVQLRYETFTAEGKTPAQVKTIPAPPIKDISVSIPLKLRELIAKPSGFIQGEVTSRPPLGGEDAAQARWLFGQITPFHVHVKLGHYDTLVWVTDLQSGNPVPGVQVHIFKNTFKDFDSKKEVLVQGSTGSDGAAVLSGTADLDPELQLLWPYEPDEPHLFVQCEKEGDLAVVPLRYEFQVAAEGANRAYIPDSLRARHGHMRAWGATAQGVYKLGDTVQFKIYVREQDQRHFGKAPRSTYQLKVMDPAEKVIHERVDIRLSDFGALDGEFPIPQNGAVGWYRFVLAADFSKEAWEPMRVLVSDFTPSPFRVSTDLNGDLFQTGDAVKVTTQARLHSGGPYAKADARVTALLQPQPFAPQNSKAKGFEFDVLNRRDGDSPEESPTLYQIEGKLNDEGTLESTFTVPQTGVQFGRLVIESAVEDDRGKRVAQRTSATYAGRDRYVGLAQDDWTLEQGKPARVRALVVDRHGEPAANTEVRIRVERKVTKASRVKGAGSAYLTHYEHEWVETGNWTLMSELEPKAFEITPEHPGAYRITARIDTSPASGPAGGEAAPPESFHETRIERWVVGQGQVLWESAQGNVMNLFPEKETYRVGETARFLVQNPFPGAQALVTVERFGVIQRWVKALATSTEIIEVPVEADHLPGFYLSVLAMSPRVDKPMSEENAEDLGKPTFRMGYAQVQVNDDHKEIAVSVKPEREVYKPRETITAQIEARPRHPAPGEPPPPVELAVAVLDEAVFDLLRQGRKNFDPYEGFYSLDPLDLNNYNLLMQLVDRQKLEKKGASPGGDGGADLGMRSVFKFVSYWNPSIPVDASGKAVIQFEAPDNLTGWRILVMAVTPEDRMGLGDAVVRVNQPTEIRPVLPNQVTEGDVFEAGFTVMNRTPEARTLQVTLQADGPVALEAGETVRKLSREVRAEPYERTTIRLPLQTTGPGVITLTAEAGDGTDRDALRHPLAVQRRQALQNAAVYGSTTEGEVTETIALPEKAQPQSARLSVNLSPTLLGGMEGAFAHLRDYPYTCWEQILSRAVMASLYQALEPYLDNDFTWPDNAEAIQKAFALAAEHQAPNGGMTFYVPKDDLASPYLSAYTALAFNWLKDRGHEAPQPVEERLHQYLKQMLRRDVDASRYSKGMLSTVRAVALAALAERNLLTRADLERYSTRIAEMSLFGRAHYLQALLRVPGTAPIQYQVLRSILNQADQRSGKLGFKESLEDRYQYLLTSRIRDESALLSALVAYQAANPSDPLLSDVPQRLMRSIHQSRKGRDRWGSTQDNVFAVRALSDFSSLYEEKGKPPAMTVEASLGRSLLGQAHFQGLSDPPVSFDHAFQAGDAGQKSTLSLRRTGQGRLYYAVNLSYAPTDEVDRSVNAGIEIHREYRVEREGRTVLVQNPLELKIGDVVGVDLFVFLPADRYFVVVEDPMPGGLEPVNTELATASTVDADKANLRHPEGSLWHRFKSWSGRSGSPWGFYHQELRHDSARFYSEYLPAGRYHLSYMAQVIAPGVFAAMPAHAEEMYHPDVFGQSTAATLKVEVGEAGAARRGSP